MGHLVFLFMHFLACLFGFLFLFITIPLHLIYGVMSSSTTRTREDARKKDPHSNTHFRCPDCKEFVLKEANVCKHCGYQLDSPDKNDLASGLTVISVKKGSQGEEIGIKAGDVILSCNGDSLSINTDLSHSIYNSVKNSQTSIELLVKQNEQVNKIIATAGLPLGVSCEKNITRL